MRRIVVLSSIPASSAPIGRCVSMLQILGGAEQATDSAPVPTRAHGAHPRLNQAYTRGALCAPVWPFACAHLVRGSSAREVGVICGSALMSCHHAYTLLLCMRTQYADPVGTRGVIYPSTL
jgi:hypothetical protein